MNWKPITCIAAISLFFACKKKNNGDEENVTFDREIIGSVNLYNSSTDRLDSDAGVSLTASNGTQTYTTSTDSNGDFTLESAAPGNYTLTYEKSGMGTFKVFNIDHTNTSATILDTSYSLGQTTTYTASIGSVIVRNDSLVVTASSDQANNSYIRFFFGESQDVSKSDYKMHSSLFNTSNTDIEYKFALEELENAGFQSGETVNVIGYCDSYFSNEYFNPILNYSVFPNTGPKSNILQVTLP